MLRMYLLQCWFNLSDKGVENAIYDSYAMRKFVGIDLFEEDAPDATTLLKFRRLLEKHNLNKTFFWAINRVMVESGHITKGGTIIDATIINAPSSTKNAEKKRDPEMHQTKKGNEWRFGMKCHAGVDAGTGLIHTIEITLPTHTISWWPLNRYVLTMRLFSEIPAILAYFLIFSMILSTRKFIMLHKYPSVPKLLRQEKSRNT